MVKLIHKYKIMNANSVSNILPLMKQENKEKISVDVKSNENVKKEENINTKLEVKVLARDWLLYFL